MGLPYLNEIVCIDALKLLRALPDKSVDISLFSPPYNLQGTGGNSGLFKDTNFRKFFKHGYISYHDDMPESDYQEWVNLIVGECLRISKGLVWVNHKTRFRDGVGIHPLQFIKHTFYSEIVWNRRFSMALNSRRFAPSHEFFYGFGKPHYWNDDYNTLFTVWDDTITDRPNHPCPYPESIVEKIISASCPDNGIVFDPFCGSGTTALAARNLGRQFICGDLSPEYVAMANLRLQNSDPYQDSTLKTGEKQLSLFRGMG